MMKIIILMIILLSSCVPQNQQTKIETKAKSNENSSQKHDLHKPIQQKAPDDSIKRSRQSIELSLSSKVYPKSCEEIEVTLTNYSSHTLTYGLERYFVIYNHGKWERINFNKDGVIYVFDAIGFELPSNTSQTRNYSLNQKLHTFVPGKYRMILPFTIQNKKEHRIVEFVLE